MILCPECRDYPEGARCAAMTCPGKKAFIPQLADGEGHQFERAQRLSYDAWEYACLLELVEAHAEGRRVSFQAPKGVSHIGDLTHE